MDKLLARMKTEFGMTNHCPKTVSVQTKMLRWVKHVDQNAFSAVTTPQFKKKYKELTGKKPTRCRVRQ